MRTIGITVGWIVVSPHKQNRMRGWYFVSGHSINYINVEHFMFCHCGLRMECMQEILTFPFLGQKPQLSQARKKNCAICWSRLPTKPYRTEIDLWFLFSSFPRDLIAFASKKPKMHEDLKTEDLNYYWI